MGSASRSEWTPGSSAVLAVMASAVLVLGACGSQEKAAGDSAQARSAAQMPADSGRSRASASTNVPEPAYTPLGTLPRPLDDMLAHPAEFKELVDPPSMYTGNFANRSCVACGGEKTKVHVGAIADAWRVNFNSLPLNGVIMGRMQNFGKYDEEQYRIPKKETWYILWGGDGASDAHMRFIRRIDEPNNVTRFELVPGWLSKVTDCGHPKKFKPDADFSDCELKFAAERNGGGAVLSANKGVWLSCSQGCCTADAAPFDLERYHAISDSIAGRTASAKDSTKK